MDYSPAASFNGYYAGWSKSGSAPQISTGVHHPGGAAKKINYDNNDYAYSDGWYSSNTHWRLSWDEGGTEGGSSGSPLFNDDNLIVGLGGPWLWNRAWLLWLWLWLWLWPWLWLWL